MDHLLRELRQGARSLARDRGFSLTVVLTLGSCIAAHTVTFAIVNSVLLRPLPGPHAQSLVLLSNRYPKAGVTSQTNSSAADLEDRRRGISALDAHAMYRNADVTLNLEGMPQQVPAMAVTPSLFPLLGVGAAAGRVFSQEEGEPGGEGRVILSAALARQLFGGASPVGRELRVSGSLCTVVGVMAPDFAFVNPAVRLWTPLTFTAAQKQQYHNNSWSHIGRLKPGATIAQVQAQLNAVNAAALDRLPQMKPALLAAGFHSVAEPLLDILVKDVRSALYMLWAGALFVLLIGGLNIANLALARAGVRSREVATRLALGASRMQLLRQAAAESLLLAASGSAAGLALGYAALRALPALGLAEFPRAAEVRIDATVTLLALALAGAVGALAAFVPLAGAFRANLSPMLREGNRSGTGGTRARGLRQSLAGAEIAFAFVLLAASGLLLASFRQLLAVDPGFNVTGVLTASTSAPSSRYADDAALNRLMERALDAIRQLPQVSAAGATKTIPLGRSFEDSVVLAEGHVSKPGESVISPRRLSITPGYFEAMRIPVLRGRAFQPGDTREAPGVVIVDERLAEHFWPHGDALGRRMFRPQNNANPTQPTASTRWYTVVGIVPSVRLDDLAGARTPYGAYYFPYADDASNGFTFAIKAAGDLGSLTQSVRRVLAGIDPELAVFDVKTMDERAALSLAPRRTTLLLALAFGALALFLSAIGVYGVLAYLVAQRHREIGIRVALGCGAAGVVGLVMREGLLLVVLGLGAGLAGVVALEHVVSARIYGVRPLDPLVLGAAAAVLGVTALAACLAPARRALRLDPVRVLSE